MPLKSLIQLLALSAIWGGSFIFMRVLAPVLGPFSTACSRVLVAGVVLSAYFSWIRFDPRWKANWRQYLIIGAVGSAAPFALFSYAAMHLPASYEVILNSTAPLFGAVLSWLWLNEPMTLRKAMGLVVSSAGVGLVVCVRSVNVDEHFGGAVAASLAAATCYGLAGVYIKKFASGVKPLGIAGGSQLMAGMLLLPLAIAQPGPGPIDRGVVLNTLVFAVLCSAVAYILYYQLIADIGLTRALTVTFLMPVFGMLWGAVFLAETITPQMIAGTLIIIAGTWLVVRKAPERDP